MAKTDEQLIAMLLYGQSSAFNEIYMRYNTKVMGYIKTKISNHEASEEVFQLTWERVYKNIHKFNADYKFSPWLFKLTTNTTIDYFRKNMNSQTSIPFDDNLAKETYEDSDIRDINLDQLESPYKEALTFKYVDGFSSKEIAEKMSLTDSNVRKILSRGRELIRQKHGRKNEL